MAKTDKNHTRDRLHNPETVKFSLKRHLITRIFCVLIIVWLTGATFTKIAAFYKTRGFLEKQVNTQLVDWLQITSIQKLQPADFNDRYGRFIMIWQNDQIMIHEGSFSLTKPSKERHYIHEENGHKWIVAENCALTTCAIVGVKDTHPYQH